MHPAAATLTESIKSMLPPAYHDTLQAYDLLHHVQHHVRRKAAAPTHNLQLR
jgi:hypothetical protein